MIYIIKNDKLDKLFSAILVYAFSVYIFCMHITESQIFFLPGVQDLVLNIPLIVYVYLIFKIVYDLLRGKYGLFIIIGSILAVALLITMQHFTGRMNISYFIILFFMLGLKDADTNLFFKSVFWSLFSAFALIVLLSLVGVIANHPVVQDSGARVRYLLGYDWNNVAHNHFFSIVLVYILFKKKLKIYDYIVIILINILLFMATTSKCAFICVFIALIIYILITLRTGPSFPVIKPQDKKIRTPDLSPAFPFIAPSSALQYIALAAPAVLPLAFGYMAKAYSRFSPFLVKLDSLLSGRLALAHKGFKTWGITLFGQVTNMSQGENYNFVDCSFLNILFSDGIIFLIVILAVYFLFIFACIKKINAAKVNENVVGNKISSDERNLIYKLMILVLFMTLLHSTIEPWMMSLTNFPLIVLFINILNNKD